MAERTIRAEKDAYHIAKVPTGIAGFDEITVGGLPRNRVALVFGNPGSGKTIFALEFVSKGAYDYDEPGVFVSFEESAEELIENSTNLGLGVPRLVEQDKLVIDFIGPAAVELRESGDYELTPLLERIQHSIDRIGARRVVIDSLEALFNGLQNREVLRNEVRKLFHWLRRRGVSAVVTAEKGVERMTRHGFEEYISDCVILLDSRVEENITTRYLRIVKYRGSVHRTNEYPFMIYENGLSVLPLSSTFLDYEVSSERVSTGVAGLDRMLGGQGYFEGSTILISGSSGTGKTSFAVAFADAACKRGGRALYYALEESQSQITRNMLSIGIDLREWLDERRLSVCAVRSTHLGIETHLVNLEELVTKIEPSVVVLDAVSNLLNTGTAAATKSMLIRVIDFLKHRQVTTVLTSLVPHGADEGAAAVEISSFIDTWVVLQNKACGGSLCRTLQVVKSRGMDHSHEVAPFMITGSGLLFDRGDGASRE